MPRAVERPYRFRVYTTQECAATKVKMRATMVNTTLPLYAPTMRPCSIGAMSIALYLDCHALNAGWSSPTDIPHCGKLLTVCPHQDYYGRNRDKVPVYGRATCGRRIETMPGKWLSATEAAERLGVDRRTVSRYIAEGKLPAQETVGGHYRIAEPVIEAF